LSKSDKQITWPILHGWCGHSQARAIIKEKPSKGDLCKRIAALDKRIVAAYLIERDVITQWIAKPEAKIPLPERLQTVVAQRALLFSLAKAAEDFLGQMHHVMIKHSDYDVYLFELGAVGAGSMDQHDFSTKPVENVKYNEEIEEQDSIPIFDKDLLVLWIKPPYSSKALISKISMLSTS